MSDVTVHNVLQKLPPYLGQERLVKARQNTADIMRDIIRTHKNTAAHYDDIATNFWKGDARNTARDLFTFMKKNVGYVVEPTTFQSTKTPAAILAQGNGDCKHYASFIVGTCEALRRKGYPIKAHYCFASYEPGSRSPGHVFAVVCGPDGQEIWTDPVLSTFDTRHPEPKYIENKIPPPMGNNIGELYEISGIFTKPVKNGTEYTHVPRPHWIETHFMRHTPHAQPVQVVNTPSRMPAPVMQRQPNAITPWGLPVMHGIDDGVGCACGCGCMEPAIGKKHKLKIRLPKLHLDKINPGKLLKKAALAVPRNSFLGLLKLNFAGLAVKINNAFADPKKKKRFLDQWDKLGGQHNKLNTAVHQGVKFYNKLRHKKDKLNGPYGDYDNYDGHNEYYISGIEDQYSVSGYEQMGFVIEEMRDMQSVGFAPAAIPALLAAAAPIIAAFKNILKSFGANTDKLNDQATAADADVVETHNSSIDKGGDNVSEDGEVDHGAGVKTKVKHGAHGHQEMEMKASDPTEGDDSGGSADEVSGDDGAGDAAAPGKHVSKKDNAGSGGSGFKEMLANSWSWVKDHKTYFLIGGGLLATIIIIKAVRSHHGPKRRR